MHIVLSRSYVLDLLLQRSVQWRPEHKGQIKKISTPEHLIGYLRCLETPGLLESAYWIGDYIWNRLLEH